MAINGVTRPGHVQIRVLDLDEGVHFYRDVLGLQETGRDKQGRVYFKTWDERDHNSLVIRQADRAGLDFFAFKVRPLWKSWTPTCGPTALPPSGFPPARCWKPASACVSRFPAAT